VFTEFMVIALELYLLLCACREDDLAYGTSFDTFLVRIAAALLHLFLIIDGTIGQLIRRSLKLTQIANLAGILPAFLKCLSLRVRQKVRQFAVDTELLVTCKSTCQPIVILNFD
jgi:hypothetical protein